MTLLILFSISASPLCTASKSKLESTVPCNRLLAELEAAIENDDARGIKEARKALRKAGFEEDVA
jgi:hypothetical protein